MTAGSCTFHQPQPAPTLRAREDVNGKRPVHQSCPSRGPRRTLLPRPVRTCGRRWRGCRGIEVGQAVEPLAHPKCLGL
jgi:hypothetical protein